MPFRATCPGCNFAGELPDEFAGKKVRCRHCSVVYQLPEPKAAMQPKPATQALPPVRNHDELQKLALDPPPWLKAKRFPLSLAAAIGAGAALVVLLLVGGIVGVSWLLFHNEPDDKPQAVAEIPNKKQDDAKKLDKKEAVQKIEKNDPQIERKMPKEEFNLTEARKSVVYIKCSVPGLPTATGSGFLVNKEGLVYTNRHVIQPGAPLRGYKLLVGVPSAKNPDVLDYFAAETVYRAPERDALDFAVLKITAKPDYGEFKPLPLAQGKVTLGMVVAAVGYPATVRPDAAVLSFNKGNISATLVKVEEKSYYQTDAAVNPGNSGGPLLNQHGEAIGIVTLKKANANNMGYALYLSEVQAAARGIDAKTLANAKPAPGPLDLMAMGKGAAIPPKAEAWTINKGTTNNKREHFTIDGNGGTYWMTSKEDLPDNFQLTIRCGLEFLQGRQRLQFGQRSILRTLCIRFAAPHPEKDILMERGEGYHLQFSHEYMHLYRNGKIVRTENKGNPDESFLLTVAWQNNEITISVDGVIWMRHSDPAPLGGKTKLSIGGYLSRLYIGGVGVTALEGKKRPVDVAIGDPNKKDPNNPRPNDPPTPGVEASVRLPAPAVDCVVGGDGRFLILHLPTVKSLAVVDVVEAKIAKLIPLPNEEVKYAAGLDKLVIVLPGSRVVQRWSLKTFEREISLALPFEGRVQHMAMGAGSQGPIYMMGTGQFPTHLGAIVDLQTLKPWKMTGNATFGFENYRVSANGQAMTMWVNSGGGGKAVMHVNDHLAQFRAFDGGQAPCYLAPASDGQTFYSHITTNPSGFCCRTGVVYSHDLRVLHGGKAAGPNRFFFPVYGGPYYFDAKLEAGGRMSQMDFYLLGEDQSFASLRGPSVVYDGHGGFGFDKRCYVFPQAKRVAAIPDGNSRVEFFKFDLHEALAKSKLDYLFVTSRPPSGAERGKEFTYQLAVKSRNGGLKYAVASGPQGMKVDDSGKMTWAIPAGHAETSVVVILSVTDKAKQEVFHTFNIGLAPLPNGVPVVGPMDPVQKPRPPQVGGIKVAPLDRDRMSFPLPAPASSVTPAGSGRFLLLTISQLKKLAVFDVNESKVIAYLPLPSAEARVAGGKDLFLVMDPQTRTLQRWSLATLEREAVAPITEEGKLFDFCLGMSSNGPAMIALSDKRPSVFFVDPRTLKKMDIAWPNGKAPIGDPAIFVRASADGRVFTMRAGQGGEPHACVVLTVDGTKGTGLRGWVSTNILVPAPDGKWVYGGNAVYSLDLKAKFPDPAPKRDGRPFLPSPDGGFFVRLDYRAANEVGGDLAVFLRGETEPIVRVAGVEGVSGEIVYAGKPVHPLQYDERVHFLPAAKVILTIPPGNREIIMHRFDLDQALEKSGIDYLWVVSRPVEIAVRGKTYQYPLTVKSKKGGVTYRLESGPQGMKISDKGVVTWDVPADFEMNEVAVIVAVGDSSAQLRLQSFRVAVGKAGGEK